MLRLRAKVRSERAARCVARRLRSHGLRIQFTGGGRERMGQRRQRWLVYAHA